MNGKIVQNTNFARSPSAQWLFLVLHITVNSIIQKLKSKHLVCLSFLRWQSFWGNKRKYFTHIPGLSQFSLFFLIEEKESVSLKMTCIWKSCRTFKFLSSNQSYFYFGWAVWHSINQNHSSPSANLSRSPHVFTKNQLQLKQIVIGWEIRENTDPVNSAYISSWHQKNEATNSRI